MAPFLDFFFFFLKSWCHTKRRMGMATIESATPDIWDLFPWCRPYGFITCAKCEDILSILQAPIFDEPWRVEFFRVWEDFWIKMYRIDVRNDWSVLSWDEVSIECCVLWNENQYQMSVWNTWHFIIWQNEVIGEKIINNRFFWSCLLTLVMVSGVIFDPAALKRVIFF